MILLPSKVIVNQKQYAFFIGINLIISVTLLLVLRIIPNIPTETFIAKCVAFVCLEKEGNTSLFITLRAIFGFSNFVSGVILMVVLKKVFNTMKFNRTHGKNIIYTILMLCTTTSFNFIPNLIGLMLLFVS